MKKVFMMLALVAFFSMTATSCGEEKKEGEATEHAEGDGHDHAEGEEHAH